MMSKIKISVVRQVGFTLVEVVIAVSVFAVISIIIAQFLNQVFLGNNKASLISNIKQNGQNTLGILESTIRNADDVVCIFTSNEPKTLVVVKDGEYTRVKIYNENMSAPLNGYITKDIPTPTTEDVTSEEVCDPTFQAGSETEIISQTSGISVTNGTFELDSLTGFKDVVTVKFSLKPMLEAGDSFSETIDPIYFQTSIQLLR